MLTNRRRPTLLYTARKAERAAKHTASALHKNRVRGENRRMDGVGQQALEEHLQKLAEAGLPRRRPPLIWVRENLNVVPEVSECIPTMTPSSGWTWLA